MRLLLALAALMAFGFTVTMTVPTQDNLGTCAAPILTAGRSDSLWAVIVWSGPTAGRDSLKRAKGAAATFTLPDVPGTYTVRGYARKLSNAKAGCDTTFTRAVATPDTTGPAPIRIVP